jgi:hypothetical protein
MLDRRIDNRTGRNNLVFIDAPEKWHGRTQRHKGHKDTKEGRN